MMFLAAPPSPSAAGVISDAVPTPVFVVGSVEHEVAKRPVTSASVRRGIRIGRTVITLLCGETGGGSYAASVADGDRFKSETTTIISRDLHLRPRVDDPVRPEFGMREPKPPPRDVPERSR